MRIEVVAAALLTLDCARFAAAQSLAQQVTSANGVVQILFPSRPSACGDGQGMISNVFGYSERQGDGVRWSSGSDWSGRSCVHGPVRLVVTVIDGEPTRTKSYVGPVPAVSSDVRTITASATDAAAWMSTIVTRGNSRVASELVLPLVLADAPDPWPLFLKIARDESRPRALRQNVMMWLSNAVSEHLGLTAARDNTDDDELRTQAVYVLSQRPKQESVPQLIELAKSAPHASARRSAIYWLGQTGDPRAVDVYEELLRSR
jgi:hypothetical protein